MNSDNLVAARGHRSHFRIESAVRLFASRVAAICLVVSLLGPAAQVASASVGTSGNVFPSNNPFLPGFQGLPLDGNEVDEFEDPGQQTKWEGLRDTSDPMNITNVNMDVIVGSTSFGLVHIDGGSLLNFQDLIIGDTGEVNGQTRFGTGVVRITGSGSTYNNAPTILPPWIEDVPGGNFSSKVPRETDFGFDLWVGRFGTGTLEISGGGRAEIQDAVIVGDNSGATGSVIVDGFDSFLGSGGFDGGGVADDRRQMIVGRQGVGFMTISGGGTVYSEARDQATQAGRIGAVIGSDPFDFESDSARPRAGGQGTVTVTGTASKWIVGGSLQIGGFHNSNLPLGEGPDVQGVLVEYNSEAGRGTLKVNDGGLVSVRAGIDADTTQEDLLLAIGRFGRLELAGGHVRVDALSGPGGGFETRSDRLRVINDGVITGSGRIDTGVFLNRYLGEVRVGAGQTLVVDASADFRETLLGPGLEPLLNFGTIRVMGTIDARAELEFERAPNTEDQPIRPFFNRRVARPEGAPSTQFQGGLISAQHATLRFRSGIVNEGMMAFSAGANYVSGNVLNWCNPDDPEAHGIITVSGPGTKVTFENDLLNTSVLDISGGAVVEVLDRHSFLSADKLNVNLSLANPVPITVSGDVGLNGILNISLAGDITSTLKHGDSFEIISFAGQAYRAGIGDDGIPFLGDPLTQFAFPFQQVNVAPDIPWLARGLFPIVERIDQGIYLSFLGGPGSPGGPGDPDDPGRPVAVPPDFNGDGVVDELDLAIWLANVGIASGATVLQGDANGDGRIDGDDFLIWQRNVGMAPPWNGAGAGSGLPANVPEPSALVMLISGGLLALASRRRRSRC